MSVLEYIEEKVKRKKMHMTLIDPAEQEPGESAKMAYEAYLAGTDAIMIGGSTNLTRELMDETILAIKEKINLPVIIFPSGVDVISQYADAIYFMSLLNSRDVNFVIRQQVMGAPIIKKIGLEPIPMGYLIIEPGMTAGRVGQAELIKRDDIKTAIGYALAAQYLGMKLVYLEAGSGAPEPVPQEMISAVKKETDIPLIVGGGIRTPQQARAIVKAGADIIVTGTLVEEVSNIRDSLKKIIEAISL